MKSAFTCKYGIHEERHLKICIQRHSHFIFSIRSDLRCFVQIVVSVQSPQLVVFSQYLELIEDVRVQPHKHLFVYLFVANLLMQLLYLVADGMPWIHIPQALPAREVITIFDDISNQKVSEPHLHTIRFRMVHARYICPVCVSVRTHLHVCPYHF